MLKAIVTRDPRPRRGLPAGFPGEVRSGFEFYTSVNGKKGHFITIEMTEEPVLYAVTDEQAALYRGAWAVPMKRRWGDIKIGSHQLNGMWLEIPRKRKRTVEDRYHWLEFEKPGRNKPCRSRCHVLKAVLKQQNRLV